MRQLITGCVYGVLNFLPTLSIAAEKKVINLSPGNYMDAVLYTLMAILVVMSLLYWFKKKSESGISKDRIKIIAKRHVGQREQLLLVGVDSQKLLVGVTQGQINLITHCEDLTQEEQEELSSDSKKSKGFGLTLQELLGKS